MLNELKNYKTTVTVIVGAVVGLLNNLFNLNIPIEAIIAVIVFFVGLFAKDASVGSQPGDAPAVQQTPEQQKVDKVETVIKK